MNKYSDMSIKLEGIVGQRKKKDEKEERKRGGEGEEEKEEDQEENEKEDKEEEKYVMEQPGSCKVRIRTQDRPLNHPQADDIRL